MSSDAQYSITDVAALAGTTPRTVRYYVAQGLLPAPEGAGAGAHYTDAHMGRLRLIRRLQRQHLPLSDIRQRLATLGDREVAELIASDEPGTPPADSALDYLRTILVPPMSAGAAPAARSALLRRATSPLAPPAPAESLPAPFSPTIGPGPAAPMAGPAAAPGVVAPRQSASPDVKTPDTQHRSQWDRIGLTPNIEIHVRRPLGRLENKRVERLITIARQLLKEDQP
jgi:DNA-binding transcriptional MerR regulator